MTVASPSPSLPAPIARAAAAVLPALSAAAERTGVEFGALFHTARLESGFNPSARAGTSSATGLFQFIDSTWLSTLATHGPRHGIVAPSRAEALALRRDPVVAALMAAEHMADNGRKLSEGLGQAASGLDLYLAHFLGAGGALRFLKELKSAPETVAAALMPAAARANRAIFYERGGQPRTLQQVHDLLGARFGAAPPAGPPAKAASATPAPSFAAAEALPRPDAQRAAQAAYLLLADLGG